MNANPSLVVDQKKVQFSDNENKCLEVNTGKYVKTKQNFFVYFIFFKFKYIWTGNWNWNRLLENISKKIFSLFNN